MDNALIREIEDLRRRLQRLEAIDNPIDPQFITIGADGNVRFKSTATFWDDITVNLANVKAPAADPPTWTTYKGCELPAFGAGGTNVLYFTCQLTHKYKEGSDINFHFHAAYPDNGAGNSHWQLTYSWSNINGTFAAQTTVAATFAAPAVADHHSLHNFGAITGTSKTISSVLLCSLSRLGANGADTYASSIYAVSADIHCEMDSLGSNAELTK